MWVWRDPSLISRKLFILIILLKTTKFISAHAIQVNKWSDSPQINVRWNFPAFTVDPLFQLLLVILNNNPISSRKAQKQVT